MNFINKLERKFGRYAIQDLMKYIIALYALGYVINYVNPYFYNQYLILNIDKVLQGQVWRLLTFLVQPISGDNIFFMFISLYLYYMIGSNLERTWGSFRFNLYFLSGIIFNILAVVVIYILSGGKTYIISLDYINQSMFFAFAALYPNVQLLFMFIIPIKIKYFAYLYAAEILYVIYQCARYGDIYTIIVILFALANFIIFFASTRNYRRISPSEIRRRQNYKRQTKQTSYGNVAQFKGKNVVTRHKCAVCGRTELDDDNLEFRFCSKCEGNYEYCMDHLFTHEHVKH